MDYDTAIIGGREFVLVPRADFDRDFPRGGGDAGVVYDPEHGPLRPALPFIRQSIAGALRKARAHAGLTQGELAKKLKVTQAFVSQTESGKTKVSEAHMKRVLKACGLPADWPATPALKGARGKATKGVAAARA